MDEPIFTGAYLTNEAKLVMHIVNKKDQYQVYHGEDFLGTFDNFCAAIFFAKKYGIDY